MRWDGSARLDARPARQERSVRVSRALVLAALVAGCAGASQERAPEGPVVELADSAGVEVATVTELPALDDPAFEWRHTVMRVVPGSGEDPSDEPPFYNPERFIGLEDGTLVVADRGEYRVVVIGPDGSVLRRFGRQGRGPGEIYGSSPAVWLGPDGAIMVATWRTGASRASRWRAS